MYLKNLAKIRKGKKLTQEGLARKANVSYHTIVKLESGKIKNPTMDTIVKLVKALEIDINELVNI
jgi:transcriptional regulator with XRE-family HTH domain